MKIANNRFSLEPYLLLKVDHKFCLIVKKKKKFLGIEVSGDQAILKLDLFSYLA